MNRRVMIVMAAVGMMVGGMASASATGSDVDLKILAQEAGKSISAAETAIEEARIAIEEGKQLVVRIPADSPHMAEVKEMLAAASENWGAAVAALDGAKQSASRIQGATNQQLAKDYKLLATVNSRVAFSGAKVVQTGLFFIDSVANNRSESLDLIRMAMQDSLAASSQVQFNYDRVKKIISKKYSN